MINYVYVWFANFRLRFLGCLDQIYVFTDIFLNTYLCMKFSMYIVFAKAKPLEVSSKLLCQSMSKYFMALTESLSVIRKLNHLNSLITGKTSYLNNASPLI